MQFVSAAFTAIKMLLHKKKRLLRSLGALTFCVLIMFMEFGFFNGVNDSQSSLATLFKADLLLMHHRGETIYIYDKIDRIRLAQTLGFEQVVAAIPLYRKKMSMKNPQDGTANTVFVMAFPPDSDALDLPHYQDFRNVLKKRNHILFDRRSRKIFGEVKIGETVELDGKEYTVGDFFELGPNFSNDGTIVMGDTTYMENISPDHLLPVDYGLIRVKAGTDLMALKREMKTRLPDDVLILTPEELRQREVIHTIKVVPIGAIFGVGMIIGFIIGLIVCYQLLYNEVADHMPQFATLRAIGFPAGFLVSIVLCQALILSVLGFVPGIVGSYLLYRIIESGTGITMVLTQGRVLVIFALTIFMCVLAGLITVTKANRSDPAEVFH